MFHGTAEEEQGAAARERVDEHRVAERGGQCQVEERARVGREITAKNMVVAQQARADDPVAVRHGLRITGCSGREHDTADIVGCGLVLREGWRRFAVTAGPGEIEDVERVHARELQRPVGDRRRDAHPGRKLVGRAHHLHPEARQRQDKRDMRDRIGNEDDHDIAARKPECGCAAGDVVAHRLELPICRGALGRSGNA